MRRAPLLTLALALLLAGAAATGCGIADPYEESSGEGRAAAPGPATARPAATPRRAATPREVVLDTPRRALRYAAELAGNWTRASAAAAFARLAAISVGGARAEFARVAAQARIDVQQVLGYARSEATVEAVDVKGGGGVRRAIVVTRQRIATPQLAHLPPEYEVILATLCRYGRGWAITSWRPQP